VDVIYTRQQDKTIMVELFSLDTQAKAFTFKAHTEYFIICFTLLGAEYVLPEQKDFPADSQKQMQTNFLGFTIKDFKNFPLFCKRASQTLTNTSIKNIDQRKVALFDLVYKYKGGITVQDIADRIGWSSRQVNRYFSKQIGISLKTFCMIIRFRASFNQIRNGKLYPEQNFSDQAHFIKQIKKFSSFIPTELAKNENDRFIQFSILPDD
jgi:AraC-like DNA-binding protein